MYQTRMLQWRGWRLTAITAIIIILVSAANSDALQSSGPIILPAQSEITLQEGQNFTLICKGNDSNLRFKHQETNEEHTSDFVTKETNLASSANERIDENSKYSVALDLIHVDSFAVGYYACFDSTVNSSDLLTNIFEEPTNTEHISYIYIYVNGSYLNTPMRTFVITNDNSSKFLIECKPTAPDVNVKLTVDFADINSDQYWFSDKLGFILDNDVLSDTLTSIFICAFMRDDIVDYKDVIVHKYITHKAPQPKITRETKYFRRGETFSLNCTVEYESANAVVLNWSQIPGSYDKISIESNKDSVIDNGVLYSNITITDASEEDAGSYVCTSQNMNDNKTSRSDKYFLDKPLLEVNSTSLDNKNREKLKAYRNGRNLSKIITVYSYPPTKDVILLKDNVPLPAPTKAESNGLHSNIIRDAAKIEYTVRLFNLKVTDSGNYTIRARNEEIEMKTLTFELRVTASPSANIIASDPMTYLKNQSVTIECEAIGYPQPNFTWTFAPEQEKPIIALKNQVTFQGDKIYKLKSQVRIERANMSGIITCNASNSMGSSSAMRQIWVYEIDNGFGITPDTESWFPELEDATLTCIASKYKYSSISWTGPQGNYLRNVNYTKNDLSYIAQLYFEHISTQDAGDYQCIGLKVTGNTETVLVPVTVAEQRPLEIISPEDEIILLKPFQTEANFTCSADSVPEPEIEWYKDGELLNWSGIEIDTTVINHTKINSVVNIHKMNNTFIGKYECRVLVKRRGETKRKFYTVKTEEIAELSPNTMKYLIVIGAIVLMLVILIVYLCMVNRKEKRFRKELAAAGLLYFKEGLTKSINPELGISDQAELLPYDDKFEFPADKLILGKQLGAGAFGVVYKAEARGIINAEETTTVAVKMVKKTADNMYIKALASELKIMVHLGKHINIVNLLGACTKNVGKRELSVIVEYCRYGNIHRYLQQHREVFIDTLNENPDRVLGKVNKGYSSTSANSGVNSDYFTSSNHTQNTDQTLVTTANTNRSGRRGSETGYIQPEWRSNYESDYSCEGRSPRPLFSRDLLCWAFQIARGMEYLASRKVLHGDLAARNILLTDDNVVKICDFGLARSIYKNDEYHKKENSLVPVKWLALECLSDRIFSTQSDVWSFGVVLWELFSLAKTPYPHLTNDMVYPWLCAGNRLKKPPHADDKLYDVMRRCWEQKPTARPSFSQLQEIFGSFLEENVRNHYVDLNDSYMNMNKNQQGDAEDYLAMMSAPDYRNLCTPSDHHYENETRTFVLPVSSQLEHDEQGYLQMSPARQSTLSPRSQNTKFDFDDRKLTSRISDGSELTPMLTLNNLPRSGSESDHEDNQNAPSYLNIQTLKNIEEENDNVFELKPSNKLNSQANAVTNPSYTFQFIK